jgi:prolipoprotein diacylglyceryl transferase
LATNSLPAGIIGGRIYFLLTSWDQAPHTWWGPFAVWRGGLGIWGGIAAGTAAGLWVLHRRRADIPRFLDAAAPALLVAQSIGRVGNYFNQELFGGPTTLPWALHIDLAHRPAAYAAYSTFHPTFLSLRRWPGVVRVDSARILACPRRYLVRGRLGHRGARWLRAILTASLSPTQCRLRTTWRRSCPLIAVIDR